MRKKPRYDYYFRILLLVLAVTILISSFINFKISTVNMKVFIISIIAGCVLSTMAISGDSSSIDMVDSAAAFVFIFFGKEAVIFFTLITTITSYILNSELFVRDKDNQKLIFNSAMLVIAAYSASSVLQLISTSRFQYNLAISIDSIIFVFTFLFMNLLIFITDFRIREGKWTLLSNDDINLLGLNFFLSSILSIIQCMAYKSSGILGLVLVFVSLIVIQLCLALYKKLKDRNSSINGLLNITRELVRYGDFVDKSQHFVINLKEIVPYTICAIYTFEEKCSLEETFEYVYPIAYSAPPSIDIGELSFKISNRSITYNTVLEGKTYMSKDIKKDKKVKISGKLEKCVNAGIFAPVLIDDEVAGLIMIGGGSDLLKFMDKGMEDVINILSNQFALAIENDMIYRKIKNEAEVDDLTGLYNRGVLKSETQEYIKTGIPFSLVMIDIDDFKQINDRFGHLIGDEVLRNISKIIKMSIRKTDTAFRYGGEEIIILFKNLKKDDAFVISERIRKSIENSCIVASGAYVRVTISGGVSSYPDDGNTISELIGRADDVLYKNCKRMGKNKISKYSAEEFSGNVIKLN
jgi:diguanylate cyclase (GGDEF)-like protein